MSATVIRSSEFSKEHFSAELEKLKGLSTGSPAIPVTAQPEPSFAPPSLEQVNAQIGEYRLALEGDTLPDPIRKEVEHRLEALVRQQFILVHGFVPDADGNNPAEMKAIVDAATETATKSVIESLTAASESQSSELEPPDDEEDDEYDEEFDLDEQVEVLNAIDEADAVVVSPEIPTTIPAPVPGVRWATGGIFLPADVCSALRASMVANLPHITTHILTLFLGK